MDLVCGEAADGTAAIENGQRTQPGSNRPGPLYAGDERFSTRPRIETHQAISSAVDVYQFQDPTVGKGSPRVRLQRGSFEVRASKEKLFDNIHRLLDRQA